MKKVVISAIIAVIISTVLLYGIYNSLSGKQETDVKAYVPPKSEPVTHLDADTLLSLVNAERAKTGVAPLVSDPRLVATAQGRVDDMVARKYFSHNDPITGESLVKIKASNPECAVASENIDEGTTNQEFVDEWMNSKPHHDAMLDAKYTLTGVAVVYSQKNGWWIAVQHFCQNKLI